MMNRGSSPLLEGTDADLRYELKLVCQGHRLAAVRSWIRLHPEGFVVAYPPRRVYSLYLDTLSLSSFEENLAGVSDRQKLRLRWYGDGTEPTQPVLELKQKRNLLGRKKQLRLPCTLVQPVPDQDGSQHPTPKDKSDRAPDRIQLDLASTWRDFLHTLRACAGAEWRPLLGETCQPTVLTHYEREYYATLDGALRVTLDHAWVAYDQRTGLRPNLRCMTPLPDRVVIELKAAHPHIERLAEAAAHFPIQRTRNSKYASSLRAAGL